MAEHTQGPFDWNDKGELVAINVMECVDLEDEPMPKVIIVTDSGFYPPFADDREFIKTAMNAHDDLVKALRGAHRFLRKSGFDMTSIDAALAKAGAA